MRRALGLLAAAGAVMVGLPGAAGAHGPTAPVATSYLDRVSRAPYGVDAKVVDGWVRLWLRVAPTETVVVLDYGGAPYLWFSAKGVRVNTASSMYYLNQNPPRSPPSTVSRTTALRWRLATNGHDYEWHDGRLGALTSAALAPGASYVGRWTIPVLVDGRLSDISGTVWHAPSPSLVWWWPIVVLLACLAAALRLPRWSLHARIARGIALVTLAALAVGGAGHELHGRPAITAAQLIFIGILAAFVGWSLVRLLLSPFGYFPMLVIGFVAIWTGAQLIPTLTHGFVLIALPAFAARTATVLCLGGGVALLALVFRMVELESGERRFSSDAPGERRSPGGVDLSSRG